MKIIKPWSIDKVSFTISRIRRIITKKGMVFDEVFDQFLKLHRIEKDELSSFTRGSIEFFNSKELGIQMKSLKDRLEFNLTGVYFLRNSNGFAILRHFFKKFDGRLSLTRIDYCIDFLGSSVNYFEFRQNQSGFGKQSKQFFVIPERLHGAKGKQENVYFIAKNSRIEFCIYRKWQELEENPNKKELYEKIFTISEEEKHKLLRFEIRFKKSNAKKFVWEKEKEVRSELLKIVKNKYLLQHLKDGRWQDDFKFIELISKL